jgi:O-succinylbenzoic acid--CoA ligase
MQLLKKGEKSSWTEALIIFLENWFNPCDYIEVQTSGSTGEPKVIRLSKEKMMNSARMTCRYFGLTEESNALLCLPADYIAGKMMIVRAFVSGMNLVSVKPEANPFRNLKDIIDFTAITPYQFINSYQSIQEKTIKKIIIGGSQVSLRLQKLMANLQTEILETYGMTETCSHIALKKLNGRNASEFFEVLPEVHIDTDERSCLVIEAPALAPERLITNDVVEIQGNNRFKWLGRFDNVVNTGGIKIFPEQTEKKLEPYIDQRFFVTGMDDELLNQKLVLVIESTPWTTEEEENLMNRMNTVLSLYEKPKTIYYREKFTISSSGKILKIPTLSQG